MNRPAFGEAAGVLRTAGHLVFNPAEHEAGNLRASLAADMMWISLVAEAVALLPGWQDSLGATAEVALAAAIGIPCRELADFTDFAQAPDRNPVIVARPSGDLIRDPGGEP